MKNLRRLSIAVAFTLALAIPAFADGEISTTVAPPPPSSQAQATTTDGEISTTITGQAETASSETAVNNSATEATLNLLQSVLSLF
jgi:FlaG/FlaF family flagellin (archaellin)